MPAHVVAANNYSLVRAAEDWRTGTGPETHLWGTGAMVAAGYDVTYLDLRASAVGRKLSALARDRLGDADVERRAVQALRSGADLLYAADPRTFAGLALARRARALRVPVMAAVHPTAWTGWGKRSALRGYDEVITLSTRVRDELIATTGRSLQRTTTLGWGPDLRFPGYVATGSEVIVCTGKTQRDTGTLLTGLAQARLGARVHVRHDPPQDAPPLVDLVVGAGYAEVLADLRRASVVTIPLLPGAGGAGITELNDALALSKPVLMTRNPYIDVDIEAIGCGRWIEPGDASGWARALAELSADPQARSQMGALGRAFAERHHNAELFNAGVLRAAERAMGAG